MEYDQISFFILKEIIECSKKEKELSPWILAKSYPFWDDLRKFETSNDERYYFTKKSILIKNKLNKMVKEGFIQKIRVNEVIIFKLDEKKINIRKFKFPDKEAKALCIKESDNHWSIFEI